MESIRHYLEIKSPAGKVYKAITEEDGLKSWWTDDVIANPEKGSIAEFRFGDQYHDKMRITNLTKNKNIQWVCIAGHEEWLDTEFIFDLEERAGKTILRFVHGKWREATDFFGHCNYHWGWYMTSLKEYCETGKGRPFISPQK
jgi:uncharacterized protein YndB with AHSA1/START domain